RVGAVSEHDLAGRSLDHLQGHRRHLAVADAAAIGAPEDPGVPAVAERLAATLVADIAHKVGKSPGIPAARSPAVAPRYRADQGVGIGENLGVLDVGADLVLGADLRIVPGAG